MVVLQQTRVLASCFDCIHLGDPSNPDLRNRAYFCNVYRRTMSYDMARTPNDCHKRESDESNLATQVILDRLFGLCMELVSLINRPFTVRELFDYAPDYQNKNSLWELTEHLVKEGRLYKVESNFRTWRGTSYRVMVYWPIL
jgi:hypothetical protein